MRKQRRPKFEMSEGPSRVRHGFFADPMALHVPNATGEQVLAAHVLRQAFRDLKDGKAGSYVWWASNREPLSTLCQAIGADTEMVRQRALAAMPRRTKHGEPE